MLFTAIVAAPNNLFQLWLETQFPTRTVPRKKLEDLQRSKKNGEDDALEKHSRFNARNTLIKFLLDQSLSATTNTMLFICVLGFIKGRSIDYIRDDLVKVCVRAGGQITRGLTCGAEFLAAPICWIPLLANGMSA